MGRAIAYCRVSTRAQGQSGLGIEAQRATLTITIIGDTSRPRAAKAAMRSLAGPS